MNREQARHAESMAKHMLGHVESFYWRLQVIQYAWKEQNYEMFSLENVKKIFTDDLEYLKRELDQVNRDMLAELEQQ